MFAAAMREPDCSKTHLFSGIGFLPVEGKCEAYIMVSIFLDMQPC